MRKLVYIIVLLLVLSIGGNAQIRVSDFEPVEGGFQVARALEKDGARAILIIFPEQYLENVKTFQQGTLRVLPVLLGCETFPPDCEVKIKGVDKDKQGRTFVYLDAVLEGKLLRLQIRGLAQSKNDQVLKIVGIIVTARELPKVIL